MNYQRFTGRTVRDVMAKVRAALGDDALIIRNRPIAHGVEILASTDDAMALPATPPTVTPPLAAASPPAPLRPKPAQTKGTATAMSTMSFQKFVRERAAALEPSQPDLVRVPATRNDDAVPVGEAAMLAAGHTVVAATDTPFELPSIDMPEPAAEATQQSAPMLIELRQMHNELTRQLSSLAWMNLRHREPIRTQLLRVLIDCGFSGSLARQLTEAAPIVDGANAAEQWQKQQLRRMVRTDGQASRLLSEGGIYALIGPTGSGKTTTVAKLAAQFALRHGVQSVGLVTVDSYRIGAQDQLRTFGRLLGVRVLVAHDANHLAGFLHEFMGKKLVLIDTGGLSQRDERVRDLLASLASPQIRKLLVLNAAAQAETLEDVITAYRGRDAAGVVVAKIDEAVKLGNVIDCLIRHRLPLAGISDGQRVPEDWQAAEPALLINRAFAAPRVGPFQLDDEQIVDLLSERAPATATFGRTAADLTAGAFHA